MKINREIVNAAVKTIRGKAKHIETTLVDNPLLKTPITDVLIKEAPILRTPLSKKQIQNIKPSEFKSLMEARTDIPDELRLVKDYKGDVFIRTPEQLALYDELNNILLQRNIDYEKRIEILKNALWHSPEKIVYQRKVLPRLIEKGYDIEFLSRIRFDEHNYKYVESVLEQKDSIVIPKIKEYVNNQIKSAVKLYESINKKYASEETIAGITKTEQAKAKDYEESLLIDIISRIDGKNIKYLKEWSKWADKSPFNPRGSLNRTYNASVLDYWSKDTSRILEEFYDLSDIRNTSTLLEVISRRGHDYNSVKHIFGNTKITDEAHRLLEYKKIDKFKDITLENFDTLTIQEKKEFINSYISALSIKDAKPRIDMDITRQKEVNGFNILKSRFKIYEGFDDSSQEAFLKSYSDTLKKMIESIPVSERKILQAKADWGNYSKAYREQNPIPSLVDDLEKLPVKYEEINGKKYPVSEITNDTELAISAHQTSGDAFLNLQALEFTDPNEILCFGTKDFRKNSLHYSRSGKSYSIAARPRQGRDFWIQATYDIDSGNNASKNIVNVGKVYKNTTSHYSLIPNLLKKELDLSHTEYSRRMAKLKGCTTLDEIGKIDKEMELAIRKVLNNNKLYEAIFRPTPMGVLIPSDMPLEKINQNVLDYIDLRGIKLIRVKDVSAKAREEARQKTIEQAKNIFGSITV